MATPQNPAAVSHLRWTGDQDDPIRTAPGLGVVDQPFTAGAAITAGDWVVIDQSVVTTSVTGTAYRTVIQAPAGAADSPRVIGVALNAAADAGDMVVVRRAGLIYPGGVGAVGVNVATAVAANGPIQMSATAGRAEAAGADTQRIIGVCLDDAGATVANTAYWVDVRCLS